mgnify:CR=1 FL=1
MLFPPINPSQLLADHLVGAHATDPVVPEPAARAPRSGGRLAGVRAAAAAGLHRVADAVAPAPSRVRRPA